jgi:hypothetical protein
VLGRLDSNAEDLYVSTVAFLTWDGGGNVAVALGIGATLRTLRHSVTVLGPRSLQPAIGRQ